ncbi:MAG TPA: M14 metallopeptidase family protein [Bryobacteraceae bacterium]|nr:M14 metallopeptidase family protein [Bryobacteraceae bacterium]
MKLIFGLFFISAAMAAVPSPVSVLGKNPGDDFYLADYNDALKYFKVLAGNSDRMKLFSAGKTTHGLDFEIAVISAPANLAQLDHYKDIARQLALARGLNDQQAQALAREGKAIVHIDGGLHSNEVAGGQHSFQLAYRLLSAEGDPEVDFILNNVILVLWPSLNPEGQNMIVDWYRKNLGTPYEVSPMPWLFQEYVGHDNNRDGYMQNMVESQVVTRTEMEWNPVIFYCQHQSAPFPARIWIPPFSEPISSNIHPLMLRWLNVVGTQMAAWLDAHQMPGAIHRSRFDNWYPGFLDYTHIFRNEISFFTETALYQYATPHFYTVDDFPKDQQDLRGDVMYSSPWKGGWWHLNDAVRYMVAASMSVLDTAARYRESLLYNRYQAARDNIERFRGEPPFAYVIPSVQRDVPEAALLTQKMIDNGLEVHQARQKFGANGREYPAGSWVILMDQPYAPLAKELFEAQVYPISSDAGKAIDLPYDVTGWTLPMQMGVEVAAVTDPVTEQQRAALEKIARATPPAAQVEGNGAVFVLSHHANASFAAVNDVFAAGGTVSVAREGAETSFVITNFDRAKMQAIAQKRSVGAVAAAKAPASTIGMKKARVGLYRPWVASIDEGWTRWILENYGFAPVSIYNADIQAGHLRERFNAIIIPDTSKNSLTQGHKPGSVPGQYAGGLGEAGIDALRAFVAQGGTLVAFNGAASAMIDLLHLPVTNVLEGVKSEQFFCSGALLRVELPDANRTDVAGLPREPIVMFQRGPAFETKAAFQGAVLASYPRDRNPLESGFLLHPERIQGKAAAVEVNMGQGRVYLFGFKPQWRAQSHGTYKFFMNALYEYEKVEAPAVGAARAQNPQAQRWSGLTDAARADFTKLVAANHAFFTARGPAAVEDSARLDEAIRHFQEARVGAFHDFQEQVEDAAAARQIARYTAQWRTLLADAKSKDLSDGGATAEDIVEQYRLPQMDKEIAASLGAGK